MHNLSSCQQYGFKTGEEYGGVERIPGLVNYLEYEEHACKITLISRSHLGKESILQLCAL